MCLECFGSEGLHGYQVVVGRSVPRVVQQEVCNECSVTSTRPLEVLMW